MAEVRPIGSLRHQRNIQFRERLRFHAFPDEGDCFMQAVFRDFEYQFIVNLQQRPQPGPIRQSLKDSADGQLQDVRRRALDGGVERQPLTERPDVVIAAEKLRQRYPGAGRGYGSWLLPGPSGREQDR